jgi:hypothetical protein
MRFKQVGNKADLAAVVIRNAEASATIPLGAPVVLNMNATNDGLDVVLPSTAAGLRKILGLRYGVSMGTYVAGAYGEAVVFGFTYSLLLIRQTRSASTATWETEAARSVGEYLTIDTVNNAFVTAASTIQAVTASASTAQSPVATIYPDCVLCQTLASYASSASATSDTRTAITSLVRAFVRMM